MFFRYASTVIIILKKQRNRRNMMLIYTDKKGFLEKCIEYGKNNPVIKTPEVVWHEAIPRRIRDLNKGIVTNMLMFAVRNHELFDPKYDCFPYIYFNGRRVRRGQKNKPIINEAWSGIPFGDPYMLPLFTVDEELGYRFNRILEPMGFYVEAYSYGNFCVADERDRVTQKEWEEFHQAVGLLSEKYISAGTSEVPDILKSIGDAWGQLSNQTGDIGACVLGEGIRFAYNGQEYKLRPFTRCQGEGSWTPHVDYIKKCLCVIGAEKIFWDCGRMD